ncbi:MAG: DNA primase large subunit PriL [Candidatus Bathyarchaeia archaeon]
MAKYPFIPEAAEEVKRLDFRVENLLEPDYMPIISRAEKRIAEALTTNPPEVSYNPREYKENIEVLSFPVAIVLVSALANDYVRRRYALAEARRAYELLRIESEEKIIEVARKFGWRIRISNEKLGLIKFDFALYFIDYLRNASVFHERDWKLVNRPVFYGEVYLSKQDVARLLQEEVRRYIEAKIDPKVRSILPDGVLKRVEALRQLYADRIKETSLEPLSSYGVISDAFPPCIRQLYEAAQSGRHMSHVGRFTLTSFLLNIGMDQNMIIDLFRKSSDFNERMTRYQIEHIAGERGSGTKYTPPKCDTLQTHGVCPGMDNLCKRVKHPLTYYLRKTRSMGKLRVRETNGGNG